MTKCICSKLIISGERIDIPRTKNPGAAKSFDIKRRRAIFYSDDTGKYKIPLDSENVSFPEYHEHKHNINYGNPLYT